jgi:hypothetical protein
MWTTHVVHHSSEEYNLTTALRQPALDFLAPSFIVSNMLGALIFPFDLFTAHTTFNLLYEKAKRARRRRARPTEAGNRRGCRGGTPRTPPTARRGCTDAPN